MKFKAVRQERQTTADRASGSRDTRKPASSAAGTANAVRTGKDTGQRQTPLLPSVQQAAAASPGPWPAKALASIPKSTSLPPANVLIALHAFNVVVRRRHSAKLIGVWSARGLSAAIDAEQIAVGRDVKDELKREGFGFPPAAERLVEGCFADLVIENRRNP
jgi:hypothetical protein